MRFSDCPSYVFVSLIVVALVACSDDGSDSQTAVDTGTDTGADDIADDSGETVDTTADEPDVDPGNPYPDPGEWEPNDGPGGPTVSFTEDELYQNCAYLDGGELDVTDHHNMLTMFDGYLLMPWAPEYGRGGLTFWDISDPCNPVDRGTGWSETMRETHSIGFAEVDDRWYAVVNQFRGITECGIQFWDVTDTENPVAVADLAVPGCFYPDAYARVVLSVFWQAPYVYVAGADNGFYVVDASNPLEPELVTQYTFDPIIRVGQIQAVGPLLIVTAAEGPGTALLDVSDPANPQPIPGGIFDARDAEGEPREAYFTNIYDHYIWYARKEGGGGLMVYDISDPTNPTVAGNYRSDGNGGYVFVKDDVAFVGESNWAAAYDVSDLSNITEISRMYLEGDLDTVTPIGNVAVLSVDDDAIRDEGTSIAPFWPEPDTAAPHVLWAYPNDGSDGHALTTPLAVTFNEFVDPKSAWEGSIRLYETGTDPAQTRVEGWISTQEVVVSFVPREPLTPGTEYTLEVPAGGIVDFNGNAIEEPFSMTFTTAGGQ